MEIYSKQAIGVCHSEPGEAHAKNLARSFAALGMTMLAALFFSSALFAGEIQGTVLLEPPYPEVKPAKFEKKVKDSCAEVRTSEALLVSESGGIQNTVVWLEGDFENKYTSETAMPVLDQKACRFEPHVFIVPAGEKFQVKNTDPVAHDIRGFAGAKMLFRFEMGAGDKPVNQTFEKPGIYLLRCGFHTWMHAIAVSAPHAYYAVSDSEGRFTLKDVPAGSYKVRLWHETLGEAEGTAEVKAGAVNFSYTFKGR